MFALFTNRMRMQKWLPQLLMGSCGAGPRSELSPEGLERCSAEPNTTKCTVHCSSAPSSPLALNLSSQKSAHERNKSPFPGQVHTQPLRQAGPYLEESETHHCPELRQKKNNSIILFDLHYEQDIEYKQFHHRKAIETSAVCFILRTFL